jgi:hypothetical protein
VSCPTPTATDEHEQLRLGLIAAGVPLRDALEDPVRFEIARAELVRHGFEKVLPHLEHDEHRLTEAEHCTYAAPLARAIREESRAITAAVYELDGTGSRCEIVAATRVLHTLLALHAHHEQQLALVMKDGDTYLEQPNPTGPHDDGQHTPSRPVMRSPSGTQ